MMHYCEICRFELKEWAFKRHTLSVFHRKAKLIRAMLERNCITHAGIARRIGLTRGSVANIEAGRQSVLLHQFLPSPPP